MLSSSPNSGCISLLTPLRQTVTNALIILTVTLVATPEPATGQLAFAGSCNIQTAQLSQNYLGMYCNNLNTASFGYNWTW